MPLSMAVIGGSYRVLKLDLPEHIEKRLEALGMTKHSQVSVLNAKNHGVLIIKLRQTRFALGRNITEQIEVEPIV